MTNVVAGKVIAVRDHPQGERIWLAYVDVGSQIVRVVWGGVPLVMEGCTVPVAMPGALLKNKKVRRRRYRGEVSEGVMCSSAELGWDNISDRVVLLPDIPPGTKIQ
jgi:phenylalanyl-tRNA synthetase beta chain